MEYYRIHHQLGKFFETYYKLVDLLDRELNVRPSRAIEELYHSVLEAKRTHKQSNRVNVRELPFFGRKHELSQLEEYLSLVEKGEAVGPLLVMGQSGTGKKRLMLQRFLRESERRAGSLSSRTSRRFSFCSKAPSKTQPRKTSPDSSRKCPVDGCSLIRQSEAIRGEK